MDILKKSFPLWLLGAMQVGKLYASDSQTAVPNIIFIMADDLGWNDLGVMGSDYYETPNIDKLASEGMLFTDAYSAAANSAPSRACFMSGMYTPRHGVFTVSPSARGDKTKRKLVPIENTEDLSADFVTFAEALKSKGYVCASIGKWHLGDDCDGTGPLSQGFDVNIAGCRAGTPYSYFYPYCSKKKNACMPGLSDGREGEYLTDRLTDEAVDFLKSRKDTDKPFMLYMAHHAVHTPLKAPADVILKYRNKTKGHFHRNPVYAAMIECLDNSVGRICSVVDSLGMGDNTIIVFTSDNGGSVPVTDNFMLRGGKGMPYEGGSRVPLIVKWPEVIRQGTKCKTPVINVDFYPTFMSVAGVEKYANLDGKDLTPLFRGLDIDTDRDLFWHFPAYLESYRGSGKDFRATPYSTIRSGDWKLIYFYESKNCELYNLSADMKEQKDLSAECPKKKEELLKKLNEWLAETNAPQPEKKNPFYLNR